MIRKNVLTAIYIDKAHPQNNNTCRISIRITFNRKRKYYSTPYCLSIQDFAEAMGKPLSKEEKKELIKKYGKNNFPKKTKSQLKEIGLELQAYENKAASIIKRLPVFTFELFERHFLTNRIENDKISNSFDEAIITLKNNGQLGTSISYGCAKKSLESFNPNLRFTDITPELLRKYERWMLGNEKSFTTISMYLRHLRTIFNIAISNELVPKEIYPFGKRRYEIPTGNNKKKAIPLSEIAKIYNYEVDPATTKAMAKDYWLFSYFSNGMNFKDICLLKYKNIKGNILEFERAKTMRTKRKVEPIHVIITEDVKRIIETRGNKNTAPDNYIFPVLTKGITAERQRQLIQQIIHVVNDHMKVIAKDLGIESNLSTYTARHAFSTILQRSGVSTSFISEALGHSNEKTTQNYLAGFEDSQKMEAVKALTAFKEVKNP